MDRGDTFYMPDDRDLDRWEQIIGVRYELFTNVALKFEIGIGETEKRDDDSGDVRDVTAVLAGFQLSWVF
jgi:hypothetical protein